MLEKGYFHEHASPAHLWVKQHVPSDNYKEWELVEDFLMDFVFPEQKKAICILAQEHDHSDGYYLHQTMSKKLEQAGYQLYLIYEEDLADRSDEIRKRLSSWLTA